ncbi:hypothetical protein [Burkholderia ubonensis]|uniref:hypothetical protein n=1 Tax=Burkholderia ubonensis TaxID=101571 RepID=UPI000A79D8D5|nr:hypothetical protein [Burkholderia ubonensis]
MSRIVTIEYFSQLENGPGLFAAAPVAPCSELVAPTAGDWVRTYEYPRGLLAVGAVLASLGKRIRPVTTGVAALAHRAEEVLYDGLVRTLEVTGCIPTGKVEFGLVGETLSEYKVRHIQKRNALAMQLKRSTEAGRPDGQRAEIIEQIDDLTRVLDRVAAVQAARKGW